MVTNHHLFFFLFKLNQYPKHLPHHQYYERNLISDCATFHFNAHQMHFNLIENKKKTFLLRLILPISDSTDDIVVAFLLQTIF